MTCYGRCLSKNCCSQGYIPPHFFFYFSAGEFRTGQIPYRNVPYYLSFKTSVPGRIKDGAHPLASEKGRKLH